MNERLKELRAYLDLSMRAFASRLGMTSGAISLLENGQRNLSSQFITSVCREYGCSEHWLRTGEGEMFEPIEREDEIARIADQMLHEVEPSIRNGMHRIVADMTEEELKLFFDCAKRLVDDMGE